MQVYPLKWPVLQRISIILLHKQLRPCQPEPVDTLLHVPYHENIIFPLILFRHTCQYQLLDKIAVLVFIYEDLLIAFSQFSGRVSLYDLPVFLFYQYLQGKMFHIPEVYQILITLFLCIPF